MLSVLHALARARPCACPHAASGRVVDDLRALGFASTAVLDEGIVHWREAGYPMARGRLP